MFVAIYIAVCVILMAIVYWGAKSGKFLCFFKKHPHIPKVLTLGYIISAGCFMFPIRSDPLPLDFLRVYLLVVIYGVIALAPHIPKVLTLGYIISAGCFMFPIRSDPLPLDFLRVYLLVVIYGVIALARILGSGREWVVYMVTFVLTAVGMACRYLLEFGEESNTYNFTLFNIISYLVIIPIGTMIAYHWIVLPVFVGIW